MIAADGEKMDPKKLKILIADDEEGLRISMGGILELEGHEVVTVGDGNAAIEQVRHNSFDIAFLDVKMPGMNGLDTFKEVKRLSPETVVIMMTAFAVKDIIKDAINEGAYACINKPFDMDNIIDTVKEVSEKPFVVVIDDDPALCGLMYDRFKESGFNVVTRASGSEGVELVARKIPDVVFLDVVMDGMDGIDTLKKLKEMLGDKCPKTIIMSAHDMKNKFDEAKRLGAVDCLNKPLNLEALRVAVKKMTAKGAKPKICIVDDNRAMCEVMREVLTSAGYEVDIAYSGSEVIDKIRKDAFSIMILDAKLKDANGNGLDVYDRVKHVNPEMGVIFITDPADGKPREKANKSKYIYLHKPFEPDDLLKMIENIRDAKRTK